MNLVIVSRKGVSAMQLKRELGMKTYNSAWRMMKQIRKAMAKEDMKETRSAFVKAESR
ncbi:hypothetical protein EZS27_026551 [termite gut metagenome]|uniref:Uncharacterized protein n=1 Tax=termite gut metagenome TaxID=433724 RepID=A0A5J4QQ51_9ZZZZ